MFGEQLRKLRKEHGLTQAELGTQLGLSPSTIGMYEQRRRQPDTSTLTKFSHFFGVTIDYLLEEEEGGDKDIEEVIAEIRRRLLNGNGLKFNGRPLSSRELEDIVYTLEITIKLAALSKKHRI